MLSLAGLKLMNYIAPKNSCIKLLTSKRIQISYQNGTTTSPSCSFFVFQLPDPIVVIAFGTNKAVDLVFQRDLLQTLEQ